MIRLGMPSERRMARSVPHSATCAPSTVRPVERSRGPRDIARQPAAGRPSANATSDSRPTGLPTASTDDP